jgi:hypothetical protein
MRVLTTALGVPITTSGWRPSLSFSSGIFELGFSRFPSAYAREVLPKQVLAKGDLGCKEKQLRISLTVAHVTCLSESRWAKFSKKAESWIFFEQNGAGNAKNDRSRYSVQNHPIGSGCRGWFCRRSVVLVFAGFRTWRFVRARSAMRVERPDTDSLAMK